MNARVYACERERESTRECISFKRKKKQTKYMLSLLTASVVLENNDVSLDEEDNENKKRKQEINEKVMRKRISVVL